jgi:putative cell wall-binding protein
VTRLDGANRYATAAVVSAWAYPGGAASLFLAAGTSFPDALSGAVAAGVAGVPLLLTDPDTVPAETLAEARRLAPSAITVLGGPAAVSEGVVRLIDTP